MAQKINYISELMARLCTALRFLTILPVAWGCAEDSQRFKKCIIFFPVIGLGIGASAYLLSSILLQIFPQHVVAVLLIAYLGLISGFLHIDGLADSADGLLSSRPRAASLEIMKDSRVGSMGVVAIGLVFLAKYAALSSLPAEFFGVAVLLIPFAGRCSILFSMAKLQYARPEGGLGSLFYSAESKKSGVAATIVFILLAMFISPYKGFFVITAFLLINYLFCKYCLKKIGGATGDTLGAACELSEAAVAVALTVSL